VTPDIVKEAIDKYHMNHVSHLRVLRSVPLLIELWQVTHRIIRVGDIRNIRAHLRPILEKLEALE